MSINGVFYRHEIKAALDMFGVLNVQEIKEKLAMRDITLDETQILDGLNALIKTKNIRHFDIRGYFVSRGSNERL